MLNSYGLNLGNLKLLAFLLKQSIRPFAFNLKVFLIYIIMVISFILIGVFLIGYFLIKMYNSYFWGDALCIVSAVYFFAHLLFCLFSSYEYDIWIVKRNYFVNTIWDSKINNFERAFMMGKVAKWNEELASKKLSNKTFLLKDYIDDRYENLQPIK